MELLAIEASTVLHYILEYQYVAMFGVLFLCGVGLPLPEEVPLIASGVVVGFGKADFFLASATCVFAILIGDTIIFNAGRLVGKRFPDSWFIRFINSEKVRRFFAKHGRKAVFFARFFAGIRIGVYAYAGQHGMRWPRFIFLDLLGALISGPTSVWLGMYAVNRLGGETPDEKLERALELFHEYKPWIITAICILIAFVIGFAIWKTRGWRKAIHAEDTCEHVELLSTRDKEPGLDGGGDNEDDSDNARATVVQQDGTSDPADRSDA